MNEILLTLSTFVEQGEHRDRTTLAADVTGTIIT